MPRALRLAEKILLTGSTLVISSSCYDVAIDDVEKWCEHVYFEVELIEEYAPAWAVFPSVSFDYESVRDDYLAVLERRMLDAVDQTTARMAWRTGLELYIENPATFNDTPAESIIDGWRQGLARARSGTVTDSAERCLFGTAASLFDKVHIHTCIWDAAGLHIIRDTVTTLETRRTETF